MEKQIKSKQRVSEHGEVLTGKREVNAMLDLVKQETERIESRFLEPTCGNGNFLAEILERKLNVVEKRYSSSQFEFEVNSIIAISSIYGIDILEDNVQQCRIRLFEIFDAIYTRLFKGGCKIECRISAKYILEKNIVWGDALTLKMADSSKVPSQYIVFPEWSPIGGSLIKRRDFTFHSLLEQQQMQELPLFSDLGEDVFIPTPEKEYAPVHFLEIANAKQE